MQDAPPPPPALFAPAPAVPDSLATVDDYGNVTLNWALIRDVGKRHKSDALAAGESEALWIMARALLVAHGENPDMPNAVITCPGRGLATPGCTTIVPDVFTAPGLNLGDGVGRIYLPQSIPN